MEFYPEILMLFVCLFCICTTVCVFRLCAKLNWSKNYNYNYNYNYEYD